MKSTAEDDLWILHHVKKNMASVSSYRYSDPIGIVHRAVWRDWKWSACCGEKIVEKLQEGDAGAITCVRCLGSGA